MISAAEFAQLAKQGKNRIPLVKKVLADLDTPLSIYMKLAAGKGSFLLESVQGGENWARFSFIGLPCRSRLLVYDHRIVIERDGQIVEDHQDVENPLDWIQAYQQRFVVADCGDNDLPRFVGGLVGYFGYDTVRYIEPRLGPCPNPDQLGIPDIQLLVSDEVVVYDNLNDVMSIVLHLDPTAGDTHEQGMARIAELMNKLGQQLLSNSRSGASRHHEKITEADFVSGFTRDGFKNAVSRVREYIKAGDVMQVVPSQRLTIPYKNAPIDLYRALRGLNPSPYLYFMDMGDFQIVGSSPEILCRLEHRTMTVRPIAGSRPRGQTPEEDVRLEQELLADQKELAEHLMLIDLARNDIGRVAETGSVKVTDKMFIERYSHIMHIASNVQGELKPGLKPLGVLRATFPAGTLSGAPKVRAMEIIDELEPVKRNIYAGAVGYLSWNDSFDMAICIRTAIIKDGRLYVQAGAGIVADSDPEKEWQETMSKGRAIFRAVSRVQDGLDEFLTVGSESKLK